MATFLQFKRLTSATIRETFSVDGAPTDLDAGNPTVTITRPDGTTISAGTISHPGTGIYSFVLAGQPNPTVLQVTWTGVIGGQSQTLETTIEITGADLFGIGEFRALRLAGGDKPFADTAAWPDAKLHEARAATLDEFERILGFAPVPRYAREIHSLATGPPRLRKLMPSQVLAVSVAGTAQSVSGFILDGVRLLPVSAYTLGTWTSNAYADLVVEYVHGTLRPPGKGSQVAMIVAAMELDPGISSTASSMTTPDGVSYSFDPAGQVTQAGTVRYYGVPKVDAWLNLHRQPAAAVA